MTVAASRRRRRRWVVRLSALLTAVLVGTGILAVSPAHAIPVGPHLVKNAHSYLCLDVYGHGTADGTFIVQNPCDKADKWLTFKFALLPYHTLVNVRTGKCAAVVDALKDDTAYVVLQKCGASKLNDRWIPTTEKLTIPGGFIFPGPVTLTLYTLNAVHSGKPMVVYGALRDKGVFVVQDASPSSKRNDQWVLVTG